MRPTVQNLAYKLCCSVAGLANPDALFKASIFEGAFLDTRSSVCFGVFPAFGIFIFSLMRAYTPRLTIMSIFGTIALDIYCVSGSSHYFFLFAPDCMRWSVCMACITANALSQSPGPRTRACVRTKECLRRCL